MTATQIIKDDRKFQRLVYLFGYIHLKSLKDPDFKINFSKSCREALNVSGPTALAIKERAVKEGLLVKVSPKLVRYSEVKSTPDYKTIEDLLSPKKKTKPKVIELYVS